MNEKINTYEIDAATYTLGRLSTETANLLRGKNKADFSYNRIADVKVVIINSDKINFTGRKLEQKKYIRHSGYLGNLKTESLKDLFNRNPNEVIRRAVYGMLPNNKLRKTWMKNLSFKEK